MFVIRNTAGENPRYVTSVRLATLNKLGQLPNSWSYSTDPDESTLFSTQEEATLAVCSQACHGIVNTHPVDAKTTLRTLSSFLRDYEVVEVAEQTVTHIVPLDD